jgi:hypothetical protein|nr:MAG TPA: hypothetical protein [Caudoviricetes sp.]
MGVNVTRVVKFIRKGDKGSDAVRYWLIPSVSSVSMADVEGGDGKPTPSSVSCRLVKQVGDDTPTTIANAASAGLTMSYAFKRNDNVITQLTIYSGGIITVPTNTAYRAIDFYLYRGSQLIDTATIAIVCDGEPGEPGKDGVSYSVILSPNSIAITAAGLVVCESDDITATAYKNVGGVTSEAKDGTMRLFYTKADGTTSNVAATGVKANAAAIYTAVWFEYIVNNKTVASAALVINREGQTGAQGDRGPVLRGPQAWSDCATGYNFQCGAKDEAYKDVVLYGNNYYSCVKSHTKTASNYPGSTTDQSNGYWQLGDKIELIATKILLASYALVKNLGVECIDMRDAAGNILFQAKDGNVTCKTGTFTNIKVTGDITAEYLNLKTSTAQHHSEAPMLANGAICNSASGIILPELPQGTARSMRVLNPLLTRTIPEDLVLKPATTKVLISKSLSWLGATSSVVTLSGKGYNAGFYVELIGVREANSDYTYWLMSEMTAGLNS